MDEGDRVVTLLASAGHPNALHQSAAVLADATHDTDTLGRVEDYRFALLAIGAGSTPAPITGRLRLFLEMRGVQATVTVASPVDLEQAWRELEALGAPRGPRRLMRYASVARRDAEAGGPSPPRGCPR